MHEDLIPLLQQGRKIEAIKLYRERTGVGLKEALEAVEALAAGQSPLDVPPPTPAAAMADDATLASLLRQGRKIEAIKHYRERTGVGLAEAKAAVDAIVAQGGPPGVPLLDTNGELELLALLEQGQKLPAIRLVQERTGMGLREAKRAVQRCAVEHGLARPPGTGCAGALLAGVVLTIVLLILTS